MLSSTILSLRSTQILIGLCLLLVAGKNCLANEHNNPTGTINEKDIQPEVRHNDMDSMSSSLDQLLSTKQPRQQFKIHLAPTSSHKQRALKTLANIHHSRRQVENGTHKAIEYTAKQKDKQKISSATLKKLLNQSLPKNQQDASQLMNSSTSSASKGSNFKFVFIQRATVAPSTKQSSSSSSNRNKSTTPTTASSTRAPTQQSLAASVSKQLASSLLYSAVNLMGNITHHSAPSLSSLTSTTSARPSQLTSLTPQVSSSTTDSSLSYSNLDGALEPVSSNDIKRVTTSYSKANNSDRLATKSKPSKRPSKIYNLPVKFVANGQPNSIVFSTIKQHFATIRKLQSATQNNGSSKTNNGDGKRRKQPNQQQKKWKANSRLIYLPLKYLSNARPNRIISTKAMHKSNES